MKKQRPRIPKEQLQEAMGRLEEVLVRDGHLLPMSAEAENCPLVRPYTPLFSMTYNMFRLRRIA